MFDQVIPFRYLTREEREALRAGMTEHVYEAGEVIIRQGDLDDTRVFLLESGRVEAVDRLRDPPRRLRTITAGHYFGERLLELLAESSAFAQALGKILRDKQGIFTPFDRFRAELLRSVGMEGSYYLGHLLESMSRGAVARDVELRFLYYVSDLPLRHDSDLSARLRATEGVPPLYAITREILTGILFHT